LRLGSEKDSFERVFPIAFWKHYVQRVIDLAPHENDTFLVFKNEIKAGPSIRQTYCNSGVYLLSLDGISEELS